MPKTYSDLLKDPKWISLSARLRRERPHCQLCGKSDEEVVTQVHHGFYNRDLKPWEYPEESLWVICKECHPAMDRARREVAVIYGHINPARLVYAIKMLKLLIAIPAEQSFEIKVIPRARPGQIVKASGVPRFSE